MGFISIVDLQNTTHYLSTQHVIFITQANDNINIVNLVGGTSLKTKTPIEQLKNAFL